MWYEETRAEQALLSFFFLRKYDFAILQNMLLSSKRHFTYHFYSNSRDLENNRDDFNKNQISGYSFQLIAVLDLRQRPLERKEKVQ